MTTCPANTVPSIIVKVQLPLNDPTLDALIYDEERSWQLFVPVEHVEGLMRGRPKVFFQARIVEDKLLLGDEAPEQDW